MKKSLHFILLLFTSVLIAQTDGLSYQAVILDPSVQELPGMDISGNILPNKTIAIRFTIIDANGSKEYQESQTITTDAFGMINLYIGEGNRISEKSFDEIDWDGTTKSLQVDIDFDGGNNFTSLSSQKLTFVPYAFHRNIIATGDLTVDGLTTFNSDLVIEGQMILNNDLRVTGNTLLEGDIDILGSSIIGEDLTVNGTTNLNNELNVNNASATNLSGRLIVDGETLLDNNTSISGNLVIGETLNVQGETNLHNGLNVTQEKPTYLSGTLTVDGISTFNDDFIIEGDVIMNNDLQVNGNAAINGGLEVIDTTNLQSDLNVGGVTTINNNFNVANQAITNLSGVLKVDGASNLQNTLNVLGLTELDDDLNVAENTYLHGILNVDKDAYIQKELRVDGVTDINNMFNVNDASTSNLSGILNVEGVSNLNNELNVAGISNLNNTLNVNNASVSNLSGILNVEGVSNLNNELNVAGITTLNDDLFVNANTALDGTINVTGEATFENNLNVEGNTVIANLVVRGGNDVGGGAAANHIALFENTNPSNGNTADGIAIRIQGNASNKLGFRNRFITFYGNGDYVAGRIQSYDLLAGDLWESFPIPDFDNLFNVFDFDNVLTGGQLPSLTFNGGSLPSASFSRGSLPSLHVHSGVPEFHRGSLPSLTFSPGSLPTANLDIGEFPTLDFDGFFDPQAAFGASGDIGAMVGWGMRNGNPGFMPTGPWSLAMVPLVLAAKQVAMDQGVIYGSKGADYAEWLEKENLEDTFMFGEVVGVKGGKISRITDGADQVMTISLAPIVLGNMPDEDKKDDFEKVGFMGQVPVLTLGDVEIGDFIVASGYNDGYAKAISSEEITLNDLKSVIGKAWSGSNGNKASIINVSVGLKTNEWVEILKQQETRLNELESKQKEFESLSNRLEKLESKIEYLEIK